MDVKGSSKYQTFVGGQRCREQGCWRPKRDFPAAIQKGRSIRIAGDTRPGTVDIFEGYAQSLKDAGKMSSREVEKRLDKIAGILGRNRPARISSPRRSPR